jgi:radical SAM-linked protein
MVWHKRASHTIISETRYNNCKLLNLATEKERFRMQANYVQRLRLTFTKIGPTRYIGHLDLARTLERSLVRAQIPIAYSQGFNRRPRMALASALPLGFTSTGELADIWLAEALDPAVAREQMMRKMAPGIDVVKVEEVPIAWPSLESSTLSASYSATLLDPLEPAELEQRIALLLAAESLPRERTHGNGQVKQYDLRPLILGLENALDEKGTAMLSMHLALEPGHTGRPDEVLAALDLDPLAARVQRDEIILAEPPVSS